MTSPSCRSGHEARIPEARAWRVLVTGFNDWKDLGEPAKIWRCRDNPSCRLLVGDPISDRPREFHGPLVQALHGSDIEGVQWSFATMPVTWGASRALPLEEFDVVIHLGLGVYDRFDQLQLESGAFDGRRGRDAAGQLESEAIAVEVASRGPEANSRRATVATVLQSLRGRRYGSFETTVTPARPSNAFLCNETHFLGLSRLDRASEPNEGAATLRALYFVHLPFARDDDHRELAAAVASLGVDLVTASRAESSRPAD